MPKTRPEFWQRKFEGNVARDARNCAELRRLGWRTLIIWECEAEDPARLNRILRTAFAPARRKLAG